MKRFLLLLTILASFTASAQVKISEMTNLTNPAGAHMPVVKNGVNYKLLTDSIMNRKVDSIQVSNDSLYFFKHNGTRYFAGMTTDATDFIQNQYNTRQTASAWIDSLRAVTLRADSIKVLNAANASENAILMKGKGTYIRIDNRVDGIDSFTHTSTSSFGRWNKKGAGVHIEHSPGSWYKKNASPSFFVYENATVDTFNNISGNGANDLRSEPIFKSHRTLRFKGDFAERPIYNIGSEEFSNMSTIQSGYSFTSQTGKVKLTMSWAAAGYPIRGGLASFYSYPDFNNSAYYGYPAYFGGQYNGFAASLQFHKSDTMENYSFVNVGDINAYGAGAAGIYNLKGIEIQSISHYGISQRPFGVFQRGSGDKNVLMGSTLIGDSVLTSITSEKLYTKGGVKFDITGANNFDIVNGTTHRFSGTTGNVMIGTTTDDLTNRLQVAGGLKVTGKGTFDQTDLTGTLHEWKLGTTANTAAPNIAIARSGGAFSYSMWNADATASGQPYSQMYSVPASVVLNAGKRSTGHAGGVYAKTDSTYLYSDHTVAGGAPAASSSRFSLKGGVVRLSGSSFWMNTPLTIETQSAGVVLDGLYNGVKFRNSTDGDQFTIGVNISGANSNTYEIFNHQTANAVVKITADRVSLSRVLNLTPTTPPTSSADASGNVGDIKIGTDGNLYYKMAAGWRQVAGSVF